MNTLASHLRRTFLAGTFAAIPIVITVVAIYYVDYYTGVIAPQVYGRKIHFLGVIIAVAAIYLLGLVVSTTIAKAVLRRLDALLDRLPVLQPVYRAWKQVSITSGAGMWDKVVLVQLESPHASVLGFTSGAPIDGAPGTLCVYIPSAPIPTTGRLYFIPKSRCQLLTVHADEAFKHLLSGGNHLPEGVGPALAALPA